MIKDVETYLNVYHDYLYYNYEMQSYQMSCLRKFLGRTE